MHKLFTFLRNVFATFALVALVGISLIATLTLTPVSLESEQSSRTAGATTDSDIRTSESDIVSNKLALELKDKAVQTEKYKTQLVKHTATNYSYKFQLDTADADKTYQMLEIYNPNLSEVELQLQGKLPQSVGKHVAIDVLNNEQTARIYNPVQQRGQAQTIIIPAGETSSIKLQYDLQNSIQFNIVGEIELTY